MKLHRVGIVGLGLIGGSIGLDLQQMGYEVCGLVHRKTTEKRAKERGLAQVISTEVNVIENCSIIILALPLSQLVNPEQSLVDALPRNAVVTDVGSVKKPIIDIWEKLHPNFVASHPMTGTIETGVEAGKNKLFNGRTWITTPTNRTQLEALETIKQVATDLGSQWVTTDPETHDQAVALISHLPVFVSAALLQTAGKEEINKSITLAKRIASSGFKDTTRVGGGNPDLGMGMAMHNKSALLNAMKSYRSSFDKLEAIIRKDEWGKLKEELLETQESRPDFL
ncbi:MULTISPECIES: prephenate/arogenate dehydrogenase [unclassified Prochlorococcus]|uniref:prephenate/arogenate dehydrogenase n=1 Tax=unclassified Prochlorococcus TaxID=2627481 RepID=UPI00053385ED|nr:MULTISPECIES: prephenate/arogenate dehydrogenase [unclassified Prochlorococcus]KGG14669.1 Arogenate dehydrogenase [Prochlorococcus sp. MIT 0602]KGG15901.1 Arogenate dehydrogenase [Prochlorococcus sp. MIT 0603]